MQDVFCMSAFIDSICEGALKINSVLFFHLSYFKAGLSCMLLIRKKILGKAQSVSIKFILPLTSILCIQLAAFVAPYYFVPDLVGKLLWLVLHIFLLVSLQFFACSYEKEC